MTHPQREPRSLEGRVALTLHERVSEPAVQRVLEALPAAR